MEKTTTKNQAVEEATQAGKELAAQVAAEATAFIKKNPWAAVLGAAVIGYILGTASTRSRR